VLRNILLINLVICASNISGCSSSDSPIDNSFLVDTTWQSLCKTQNTNTLSGVAFTHIVNRITYSTDGYTATVYNYDDPNCATPNGYAAIIASSYTLTGNITTINGVSAYAIDETPITAKITLNNVDYSYLSVSGNTVLDILKVENNVLYYGVERDDGLRPTELNYNDPFYKQ